MLLAISIAIVQQVTFLCYLLESSFFTKHVSDRTYVFMIGVALFTAFLSIPSFFWNSNMIKESKKNKNFAGVIIAVATFIFGMGYIIFAFVSRIHAIGGVVF